MTAIEGFTGESQCLAMLTNPCHRPQVDFATCSSCCSLFSSSLFSLPCPPLLTYPSCFLLLLNLSLSLSLSFFPSYSLLLVNPFSFPVPLFFSHLSSSTYFLSCPSLSPLQQTSLLSSFSLFLFLSLSASVPQKEKLFYFSVAKLFFP